MRIYKQKLSLIAEQVVNLPVYQDGKKEVKILQIQLQDEMPCIWFLTNCDETRMVRIFLCMTGEELSDRRYTDSKYIGTCLLKNGLVLHAFANEM